MDVRRRVRVLVVALTAVASVFGVVGLVPVSRASTEVPGDPELGPLIAGETSYVGGTYVWTDYAYDDRGANTNGLDGGDATYPAPPHPANTADLIQVQLGSAPDGALELGVVLGSLVEGYDSLVGIGFDTDDDPTTGAPALPGGQWVTSAPLGLEHLVLLPTRGDGALLSWDGDAFDEVGSVEVDVDRDRNVLRAVVDELRPEDETWRAIGVVGTDDSGSWFTGEQPIHDLAFVRAEDPTMEVLVALREQVPQLGFVPYQDKVQADVLAGNLPPGRAVASVAFGTTDTALAEPRDGFNAFLYHSRVRLPEGVEPDPIQYNGVYQPYAVLLPPGLEEHPPMVVLLHGANQYQNVNLVHFSTQGLVIPGAYDVPAAVIFPNGRTTGWGTALAEQDALDATDDAIARLNIDADRVVLSGISSGGAGTYRLASRWPDRWAGAFSIVGGGTLALENLTNLPFRAANGLADPLVNVQTWQSSANALAAAETVDYRIVLVHNRSHDGPIAEGNCFFVDLVSRPRAVNPARVRYTVVPAEFDIDEELGLHLAPNSAYWVSGLESRDEEPASIDASSLALPGRVVDEDILRVDENVTKTADFCGPHPSLRGGNNWNVQGRTFRPSEEPTSNGASVVLTNLAAARVDVGRAGLSTLSPITFEVSGDGESELSLAGAWPAEVTISRDGEVIETQPVAGGLLVLSGDLSGSHTYTLAPA